jgi:hypothetical protein
MHGKTGNLHLLAQSVNELIDSVSTTVAETMQVMGRAIDGDLTSRLTAVTNWATSRCSPRRSIP